MFPISTTFMTRSLAYQVDIRALESLPAQKVSVTAHSSQAREGESSLDSAQCCDLLASLEQLQ